MGPPGVTFVIPCYNHGRFVAAAVNSALAQQGADVSVVVVDDGSEDGSAVQCAYCAGRRVRVIRQENRGLPAARNAGAAGATTEFLVFLDADDRVEPGFCAVLANALAQGPPEASHAYCHERVVGRQRLVWRVPRWDPLLMMLTNLHPVTTLVRRDRFEAVGGFDESLRHGYEDWDLWLKFVERGWCGVRVPEPLFIWNRHSPRTMIHGASDRHESLYHDLIARRQALYDRHAMELLARSVGMLRRCEMHWIDEDGEPINLRALERQRDMYESMAAVRIHHALHETLWGLPAPVRSGAQRVLAALKRLAPGGRPAAQSN